MKNKFYIGDIVVGKNGNGYKITCGGSINTILLIDGLYMNVKCEYSPCPGFCKEGRNEYDVNINGFTKPYIEVF